MKGKKIEVEEQEEPEATAVVDLMARLQESLARGKQPARHEAKTKERGARSGQTRATRASRRKTA
jgi:non-homologous end joining protein Ku